MKKIILLFILITFLIQCDNRAELKTNDCLNNLEVNALNRGYLIFKESLENHYQTEANDVLLLTFLKDLGDSKIKSDFFSNKSTKLWLDSLEEIGLQQQLFRLDSIEHGGLSIYYTYFNSNLLNCLKKEQSKKWQDFFYELSLLHNVSPELLTKAFRDMIEVEQLQPEIRIIISLLFYYENALNIDVRKNLSAVPNSIQKANARIV